MIVYQANKRQFIQDTFHNDIEFVLSQEYLRTAGQRPATRTKSVSENDRD